MIAHIWYSVLYVSGWWSDKHILICNVNVKTSLAWKHYLFTVAYEELAI